MKYLDKLKNLKLTNITNKQKLMEIIVAALCIFLLFYWTGLYFDSKTTAVDESISQAEQRIAKVSVIVTNLNTKNTTYKKLDKPLLPFIEDLNNTFKSEFSISDIKLVKTPGNTEQVSFRAENLYYNDLIKLLKNMESYSNLAIKNFSVKKRFDNPKRVDVTMEIMRESK